MTAAISVIAVALAATFFLGDRDELGEAVRSLMEPTDIAGGVVVFGPAGEEPQVRIFGDAGPAAPAPLDADSRFRFASLTKPVTSAAINELVARGEISFEDRLVELLPDISFVDPQTSQITVRDLLRHTSGIDEGADVAPLFLGPAELQEALGVDSTADCGDIAVAIAERPITHEPSTRTVYSNTGYCYLGLVLQAHTGLEYEQAVHSLVPEATGFSTDVGSVTVTHDVPESQLDLAVLRTEALGGAGALAGSPLDYHAFMARSVGADVTQAPPFDVDDESFWGMGWRVWPDRQCPARTHVGSMPGAYAITMIDAEGNSLVAMFNGRPSQDWAPFIRVVNAGCDLFG